MLPLILLLQQKDLKCSHTQVCDGPLLAKAGTVLVHPKGWWFTE